MHRFDTNKSTEYQITSLIRDQGDIPFDKFMNLALYGEFGYYLNNSKPFDVNGDYFTSPRVHPVFGALLAKQIFSMWEILGSPNTFNILEEGAGDDLLATDILTSLQLMDSNIFDATNYYLNDVNPIYSEHPKIQNISDGLGFFNVVISNELFDAMPVKLFEIHQKSFKEVFISLGINGALQEKLKNPTIELYDFLNQQGISHLEGYRGPVNLNAEKWVRKISKNIDSGFLITIDYGYLDDVFFSMEKSHRLIQTYYQHSDGGNLLQRIGRQDITAHVNFSHLIKLGNQYNLKEVFFDNQRHWLQLLGFDLTKKLHVFNGNRRTENLVSSLIDLNGLGNFKVLIQSKNIIDLNFDIFNDVNFNYWEEIPVTERHLASKLEYL